MATQPPPQPIGPESAGPQSWQTQAQTQTQLHQLQQQQLRVPLARWRSRSPDPKAAARTNRHPSTQDEAGEYQHELQRIVTGQSQQPEESDDEDQKLKLKQKQKPKAMLLQWLAAFWVRNKGVILVLVAQFFGCLMNVTTRMLENPVPGDDGHELQGMHPFQIIFVRMSVTSLIALGFMWWQQVPNFPLGAKEVRWLLVARGFGGFWGVFGLYWSLQYLPLGDATILTFLAPMIACWACSKLLDEPFTRTERIGAIISLVGVVFIARPASIFAKVAKPHPTSVVSVRGVEPEIPPATPEQRLAAVAMAMVGVCGATVAYTTIRWIGHRAHPLVSVNYYAFWCTVVSGFFLTFAPSIPFVLPQSTRQWVLLSLVGVTGFTMQYMLTAGLRYEKSSRSTNMIYSQMIFALIFDGVIWGTVPDVMSWVGSGLIFGSAVVVAVQKQSTKKKEETGATSSPPEDVERGSGEDERTTLVDHVDGQPQYEPHSSRTQWASG